MSTLTVTPTSAQPGQKVTVAGKGYPKRAQILVTLGQQVVASVSSDASGAIRTSFVVPNGQKVGKVIVRTAVASSGAAALTVQPAVPQPGDQFQYR